jgi:hypothetical protein
MCAKALKGDRLTLKPHLATYLDCSIVDKFFMALPSFQLLRGSVSGRKRSLGSHETLAFGLDQL